MGQRAYAEEVVAQFGMQDCHPVKTPGVPKEALSEEDGPATKEHRDMMAAIPYRQAIGKLQYLAVSTRPDIAAALSRVARFVSNPGATHWAAVKRILRYLQGTLGAVLTFSGSRGSTLKAYADADWAGELGGRKSTSGFSCQFGGGAVLWHSKLQSVIALSTKEAELVAIKDCCVQTIWLRYLLEELGQQPGEPTRISSDSQAALKGLEKQYQMARSKHFALYQAFVREAIDDKTISLDFCPSVNMGADFLTKAVPEEKHVECCRLIGVHIPSK